MRKISTKFLFIFALIFLPGCFEEEVEVTLYPDGSGFVKHRVVLSERLLVSSQEEGHPEGMPETDIDKFRETVASALEIISLKQKDLPNGSRIIELEGRFQSAKKFFLSEYCREHLKFRIAPSAKHQAVIHSNIWDDSGTGPSITQLYGLAKDLYIKRTIHLPGTVLKGNGIINPASKTVTWVIDLRNKKGLAQTKEFLKKTDKGQGYVVFDAKNLKFDLPLRLTEQPNPPEGAESGEAPHGSPALSTAIDWVSVKRTRIFNAQKKTFYQTDPLTEIGIVLSWNKDCPPVKCEKIVLLNLQDDQGKDLIEKSEDEISFGTIRDYQKNKVVKIKAKPPSRNAEKLVGLEGYIEVVKNADRKTVKLKNLQSWIGKSSTNIHVLDALNFRV